MAHIRFTKQRINRYVYLALGLLALAHWLILPNYLSHHVAQASSDTCGEPSFIAPKPVSKLTKSGEITTGDFNSDGHLDLVTTSENNVVLLLGDGAGNFGPPAQFFVGPEPDSNLLLGYALAVGDLNNDGNLDVVTSAIRSTSNNLSVLLGDGAGGFGAAMQFSVSSPGDDIALGDFDGDAKFDLAWSVVSGVLIMPGDGTGSFGPATNYPTAGGSFPDFILRVTEIADFNGDGNLDLVTVNPDSVSVLLNDGSGRFTVRTFASDLPANLLVVSDINDDGKPDVITAGLISGLPRCALVWLGDGAGNLATPLTTCIGRLYAMSAGDFDGDGKQDLAINWESLSIFPGDGTGYFGAPNEFDAGLSFTPVKLVAGDFNEDGKLDLATNKIAIIFGDGAGGLLAPAHLRTPYARGDGHRSITAGDFNEDGKPDLAVANAITNDVSILISNGTGGFVSATNFAVGVQPTFLAVGDFNGDQHLDFVTANNRVDVSRPDIVGTVSLRLGDGAGRFAPVRTFLAGYVPTALVVGDFNNDGQADLAVKNDGYLSGPGLGSIYYPSSVAILSGDGAGGFGEPRVLDTQVPLGSIPLAIAAGDLNQDGNLDLVATSTDTFYDLPHVATVSVLLGDGTGDLTLTSNFSPANIPVSVVLGDFSGDGKLDLVTANARTFLRSSNTISIRLGDGAGNFGDATDFPVGTDPIFVATGDFNADRNLDLVVANDVAITLGDGTGSFGPPTIYEFFKATSLTVGDFNGDGKADIAAAGGGRNSYITIFFNSCGAAITPTLTPRIRKGVQGYKIKHF